MKIMRWCAVVAKDRPKITYDKQFVIEKSGGLKYNFFLKGINLDFICMKMKLMKNKKIFAAKTFTKDTYTQHYRRFFVEGQ